MPVSLCIDLDPAQRDSLLATARHSITAGFDRETPIALDPGAFEPPLRQPFGAFVTLLQSGALRGCIGSLEASQPLVQAVATSAYNAAFRDRRFRPLQVAELDQILIEISVLSPLESIDVSGRESLLEQLLPGVDGLLLEDRGRRATFLPKVWEKIEAGEDFVGQLMLKAGLPAAHWSDSVRCYRYRTLTFAED